jgi:lipoyl(octanoyl) transferase
VALSDLGGPSSMEAVKPVLLAQLARQFGLSPRPAPGTLPAA